MAFRPKKRHRISQGDETWNCLLRTIVNTMLPQHTNLFFTTKIIYLPNFMYFACLLLYPNGGIDLPSAKKKLIEFLKKVIPLAIVIFPISNK